MELNKVYNMDCLEGMKQIPDNYIDLIVTDPPYGIDIDKYPQIKLGHNDIDWDKSIPSREIFDEMKRISKNMIIFGGNYMTEYLSPSRCWLIWDKMINEGLSFGDCEIAWTSFDKVMRIYRHKWCGSNRDANIDEKRYHPTQKPLELIKSIIEDYSDSDMIICDPFMGSGTTAVACKQLNRKFIGFELSSEYCKIIEKRLSQENLTDWFQDQKA